MTVLHVVICIMNKYFVLFLWLSFAVWFLTFNSLTVWMHEKVTKVLCLCCAVELTHSTTFWKQSAKHFYRQCPLFSTCVRYNTLRIFDLNFQSLLWSLTANRQCRMCGVTVEIQRSKQYIENGNCVGDCME
jgi:hypothetical protein